MDDIKSCKGIFQEVRYCWGVEIDTLQKYGGYGTHGHGHGHHDISISITTSISTSTGRESIKSGFRYQNFGT